MPYTIDVVMPLSEVFENVIAISCSIARLESSAVAESPMSNTISDDPEIEISAAIAETELNANRAVDARSTLRIIFLPKG